MDESRSLANRKICYDALGQLRLIRSVNRTDHPLSSPRHVCPIDMLGAISLPPFPTGVPASSVPPLVVIVVSSRYMSPYPQSTPWGAGSRCGGSRTKVPNISSKHLFCPTSITNCDKKYHCQKSGSLCNDSQCAANPNNGRTNVPNKSSIPRLAD